jgi:ATP-dependent DNA ligase
LKVKTYEDAEATVIEHLAGSGKHAGRLGALLILAFNPFKIYHHRSLNAFLPISYLRSLKS